MRPSHTRNEDFVFAERRRRRRKRSRSCDVLFRFGEIGSLRILKGDLHGNAHFWVELALGTILTERVLVKDRAENPEMVQSQGPKNGKGF